MSVIVKRIKKSLQIRNQDYVSWILWAILFSLGMAGWQILATNRGSASKFSFPYGRKITNQFSKTTRVNMTGPSRIGARTKAQKAKSL